MHPADFYGRKFDSHCGCYTDSKPIKLSNMPSLSNLKTARIHSTGYVFCGRLHYTTPVPKRWRFTQKCALHLKCVCLHQALRFVWLVYFVIFGTVWPLPVFVIFKKVCLLRAGGA